MKEMKKSTSAIHGATFFYHKGHDIMEKGHGAAPFYFFF
jgi:hypothetical protein